MRKFLLLACIIATPTIADENRQVLFRDTNSNDITLRESYVYQFVTATKFTTLTEHAKLMVRLKGEFKGELQIAFSCSAFDTVSQFSEFTVPPKLDKDETLELDLYNSKDQYIKLQYTKWDSWGIGKAEFSLASNNDADLLKLIRDAKFLTVTRNNRVVAKANTQGFNHMFQLFETKCQKLKHLSYPGKTIKQVCKNC